MNISKKLLLLVVGISLTGALCMAAKPTDSKAPASSGTATAKESTMANGEMDTLDPFLFTSMRIVATNPDLATNKGLLTKLKALAKKEKYTLINRTLNFKVKDLLKYAMLNPNHKVAQLHLDNIPKEKIKERITAAMVADAARNNNSLVAAAVLKKAQDAGILKDILCCGECYVLRVVFEDVMPHPLAMAPESRKCTTPAVRKLFNTAIQTAQINNVPMALLEIITQSNANDAKAE